MQGEYTSAFTGGARKPTRRGRRRRARESSDSSNSASSAKSVSGNLFDLISQKSAGKISKNTKIAGDVMGAANLPMLMQQMMSMNSTSGASAGLVDYANGILGKQIVSAPGSIPPPPAYRDPVAEYPFYDFGKEEKASEEKPASVTVPSASLAASADPSASISIATPEDAARAEAREKAAADAAFIASRASREKVFELRTKAAEAAAREKAAEEAAAREKAAEEAAAREKATEEARKTAAAEAEPDDEDELNISSDKEEAGEELNIEPPANITKEIDDDGLIKVSALH